MSNAQCFYPNGDPSKETDIPCGAGNGVGCCPAGWTCQVNGLCFLQSQNYYGRYTCTDKTWQSPGCPQICTNNNTAGGNEAVIECTPGNFCCDTNRPELSGGKSCCDASPNRFSIDGNVQMTIMSEKPQTATSSSQPVSATSQLSSTSVVPSSSLLPDSEVGTRIVTLTSVLIQDGNRSVTSLITSAIPTGPTLSPLHSNNDEGRSSVPVGTLAGIVIGAVACLTALLGLAFLVVRSYRRRKRRQMASSLRKSYSPDDFEPMYKNRSSLGTVTMLEKAGNVRLGELEGSTPSLAEMDGGVSGKMSYDSPDDFGRKSSMANSGFGIAASSISESVGERHSVAELPASDPRPDGKRRNPSRLRT